MSIKITGAVWNIRYVEPPREGGMRYASNDEVEIIADTVERAIELFRSLNTTGVIHHIAKLSRTKTAYFWPTGETGELIVGTAADLTPKETTREKSDAP